MPKPEIGEMVLYDYILPPLRDGSYRMDVSTQVSIDGVPQPLDGKQAFFDVDGPRFGLAPAETASVFPPRNGHGPFDEALPHIALGRRTLPWERAFSAAQDTFGGIPIPWMALLMFADDECTVELQTGIGTKLPAGVVARLGVPADLLVDTVTASRELINDIMPAYEELTLLAHVRQVNVEDRELAAGDSDGFFAVVMSNRIPQRGKKYRCCLVSIEERTDLVPAVPPPFALPVDPSLRGDAVGIVLANENAFLNPPGTRGGPRPNETLFGSPLVDAPAVDAVLATTDRTTRFGRAIANSGIGTVAGLVDSVWQPIIERESLVLLASWTFECEGTASFRALLQSIDVGMIGKPHDGGPTMTDTGHMRLDMIDRAGAPETVFYRGPLVATPLSRDPYGPYHSADQARRAAPEVGAEDVSYASAFEVGRLLAAADARLAQELMRWRRGAYVRSIRADTERFITDWVNGAELADPRWPILLPALVDILDDIARGVGPVVDAYGLDKLLGAPGFDPVLVQKTFGLASRDEALALLGTDSALLGADLGGNARIDIPHETLADVIADVEGLERLLGARARLVENVTIALDQMERNIR